MEQRRTSRGERNRSLSVKALGQMYEELIRLTQTVARLECPKKLGSSMRLDGDRDIDVKEKFTNLSRLNGDNKEGCGQCSKSTVPSKDGSHVKNRKLFFEEQAHVPENTKNIKNKTGLNLSASVGNIYSASHKLETPSYIKSRGIKEPTAASVKSKKQLFEQYINGVDNKSSPSPKQAVTPNSNKSTNKASKFDEYRRKSEDIYDVSNAQNKKYDWTLTENKTDSTTNREIENNNLIDLSIGDLHENNVNQDQHEQNGNDDRQENNENASNSSDDTEREFIAYQNLPPPPEDLLKTVHNDLLYQELFPPLYEGKLEGDVVPENEELRYEQNLFVYFLRTDDIDDVEDKPLKAKIIEIHDDEDEIKDDRGVDIKDTLTISEEIAQKAQHRSTIDIDTPYTTYEAIYHDIPSEDTIENNTEDEPIETVNEEVKPVTRSSNHIDTCISNVTEAFESIQTLCNQPKWHVWDIAKHNHKFREAEDESDIFGPLLDIDSDYCVETFNNGNENVLFRICIGREVLIQENDDYGPLSSGESIYDEVEVNGKAIFEEPEYYSISDSTYEDERHVSGTFFDKNKNPRIEIFGSNKNQETFLPKLKIPQLQYLIIKELIDSEENYLKRMNYIIDNYLIYFRSIGVSPDIEIVFGNIEDIHELTEKIYYSMRESDSVEEIARVFLANARIFDCYIEYLRNRSKSQQYATKSFAELIKLRQLELEDQYTCESYLLNTTHRPEQYKLILERLKKAIVKDGESPDSLDETILLIDRKIAEIKTALAIDSITHTPYDLKELGDFLLKEKFNIKKKYSSVVFLFQGGVVFCVEDQTNPERYEYVERIEMDKLLLKHCNTSTTFQLCCFDKTIKYSDVNYDFDLEASSMAVKERWVDEIQRLLWCQLQYYKDQAKHATLKRSPKRPLKTQRSSGEVKANEDEHIFPIYGNEINNGAVEGEEEPLYCEIEDTNYDSECHTMSGTFFDKDENPRIEIIRPESVITDNTYMLNVPKSQYMIIKELINTEETYLRKMRHIIDEYYLHFKNTGVPPDISLVFGNIESIYEETENLYSKLLECDSVEDIAIVFIDNAHIFDLYTDYLRNKSISFYYANTKFKDLIKIRQVELEDQYTCDSYLLNPVQRPGRYRLLLEKLEKELNKTGEKCHLLSESVKLVAEKITEANTLMTIDSIKKCPIELKKMGPFIMKETFNIKRKFKSVIFLFRDVVVICTEHQHRPDTYIYADSIELTQLSIGHNRNSTSFRLKNFDKSKLGDETKCAYTFDVEAPSMSVKEKWIDEIQRLLWGQLQYFKDQQKRVTEFETPSPLSRKGSSKTKTKSYDLQAGNHKRSTFYYDI